MGFMINISKNDALAKARGEPTKGFHNIQPNYSNPEIIAAVADKKAGRSTKFYDTGAPNVWQQYADKESKKQAQAPAAPPKVEQKQEPKKVEPAPQMEGRIATVNRKTPSRGRTIMDPLAARDEGSTYRKKLLGD